jgi:Vault protein inter-alpha-trypsin domain/von Willebrand factor type A domain
MRIRNVTRAALLSLLGVALGSCQHAGGVAGPRLAGGTAIKAPLPMLEESPHAAEPYVSLTSSKGVGLTLVEMTARAVVDDPLSFTELHLTFENPEDRTLEGRFHVVLPPGAALSRLAMKIDGMWQEGEMVEKQRARVAYEDALHRKQDPALLEQAGGNELTARVFPIRARSTKEIVLSYSQEQGKAPYALPLRGLPAIGRLHVEATRAGEGAPIQTLDMASAAPTADFVLESRHVQLGDGVRSGNLALFRAHPVAAPSPDPVKSAIVLFDTSASRALGLREQARALALVAQRLDGAKLTVACFDQDVEPIFDGDAAAFGDDDVQRIVARGALGASDLSRALAWAKTAAAHRGAARVLVLSDGVATAGTTDDDQLVLAARGLKEAGVERVDAVVLGGIRDEGVLRRLVTAGLARDGVVVDAARGAAEIARRVSETTRSNLAVSVPGAAWVYPTRIDGAQSGDEVLVYADLPENAAPKLGLGDGAARDLALRPVERPLLERAWIGAKIASLGDAAAKGGDKAKLRAEVIDLSVTHRVLSPYTALVVLETERDYERFGLTRRALGDVLAVDGGRVARKRHVMPHLEPKPGAPAWGAIGAADPASARGNMWGDAVGDSFGAGGLGLSGVGEGGGGRDPNAPTAPWGRADSDAQLGMVGLLDTGAAAQGGGGRGEGIGLGSIGTVGHGAGTGQGFGSGAGRVSGGHATAAPQLRQGATSVNGRLPPEVIQRIVRQNFGRFRLCYENGLRRNGALEGRVAVRFIIGRDGSIASASDAGSTLPDSQVVACVVRSFTGLSFPQPEGGIVVVVYPLDFAPAGGTLPPAPTPNQTPIPTPTPPPIPTPNADADLEKGEPYTGVFREVMRALERGATDEALTRALKWRREQPGDVLALVALGEALEKRGDMKTAARAYGSLVDLFPGRADMRRFAGERLERVEKGAGASAAELVLDTYEKAKIDRPDHPASHRLLGYARLRHGDYEGAFEAIRAGLKQRYPADRFRGVDRILREDLGLVAASWIGHDPKRQREIEGRTYAENAFVERGPSLRFVLNWETDANDVDFHVFDAVGGHAYYQQPTLPSGGELYADVTTGYGPECFTIRGAKASRKGPYALQAHYYNKGPMGYGMGKVEIVEHDGKGNLTFEERPYVVMTDHAFVDLGEAR